MTEHTLRDRARLNIRNDMTIEQALQFVFDLIKIILPLSDFEYHERLIFQDKWNIANPIWAKEVYNPARTFKKVIRAGNKFFKKEFYSKKFEEELDWVQNATCGAHQLNPVYPWVGYATDNFVLALQCELKGGHIKYSFLSTEYTRDTFYFLDESVEYCFTAICEITDSCSTQAQEKIKMETLGQIEKLMKTLEE